MALYLLAAFLCVPLGLVVGTAHLHDRIMRSLR